MFNFSNHNTIVSKAGWETKIRGAVVVLAKFSV